MAALQLAVRILDALSDAVTRLEREDRLPPHLGATSFFKGATRVRAMSGLEYTHPRFVDEAVNRMPCPWPDCIEGWHDDVYVIPRPNLSAPRNSARTFDRVRQEDGAWRWVERPKPKYSRGGATGVDVRVPE